MESFFFSGRRYDDPLRVSRPPYVPASVQTRSALTRTEIPLRRTGPLARSASRILPRGRGSAVATRLGRRRTDENRQGRGVNLRSPGRRCSRERDPGRGGGRSRGTVGACPRIPTQYRDGFCSPTLRRAWPRVDPRPPCAFKVSMFIVFCNSH